VGAREEKSTLEFVIVARILFVRGKKRPESRAFSTSARGMNAG
jgi:hypothetical protein